MKVQTIAGAVGTGEERLKEIVKTELQAAGRREKSFGDATC